MAFSLQEREGPLHAMNQQYSRHSVSDQIRTPLLQKEKNEDTRKVNHNANGTERMNR